MVSAITTKDYRGTKVLGGKKGTKKIGKITHAVFYPEKPVVAGFIIKRPDLLLMFKRKDRFIAFDACEFNEDGRIVATKDEESWDDKAIERLGIDFDRSLIWENMSIQTEDGHDLGYVGEIKFNAKTGRVLSITAASGAAAKALLGVYEIPKDMIRGYRSGNIIVSTEADELKETGGLAAKAGAGSAKASAKMKKAGEKADVAINDGAYALGGAIGKGKKKIEEKRAEDEAEGKPPVSGMFKAFKEEYDKALHEDE